ncbi:MAG: hypothetical protein COA47_10135 [Robiginitomaculum sp.]|nr:MAG: hypothetical protein COA47_10135 [Robiginitomaculum sp.]
MSWFTIWLLTFLVNLLVAFQIERHHEDENGVLMEDMTFSDWRWTIGVSATCVFIWCWIIVKLIIPFLKKERTISKTELFPVNTKGAKMFEYPLTDAELERPVESFNDDTFVMYNDITNYSDSAEDTKGESNHGKCDD